MGDSLLGPLLEVSPGEGRGQGPCCPRGQGTGGAWAQAVLTHRKRALPWETGPEVETLPESPQGDLGFILCRPDILLGRLRCLRAIPLEVPLLSTVIASPCLFTWVPLGIFHIGELTQVLRAPLSSLCICPPYTSPSSQPPYMEGVSSPHFRSKASPPLVDHILPMLAQDTAS